MTQEDYVSFETAKLLKEKGFDVFGDGSYDSGIEIYKEYSPSGLLNSCATSKPHPKGYPAPTLQMAMKWLREVHKIGVFPSTYAFMVGKNGSEKHVYGTAIINLETYELMTIDMMPMPTYEQACEVAIKYCLENLI